MDNLFKLERLKPGEVTFDVVAKTPEEMALVRMVNEKANEFLKKMIEYANWLESQKNGTC